MIACTNEIAKLFLCVHFSSHLCHMK